jgi:hypothetical protein
MKSRKPVELGERINKRWLGYAAAGAAGVGMLASVQPGQADIIFTSAHTTIAPNTSLSLDVNHDGIADFQLTNSHAFLCVISSCRAFASFNTMRIKGVQPDNGVRGYAGFFASRLAGGARIGPGPVAGLGRAGDPKRACNRSEEQDGRWKRSVHPVYAAGLRGPEPVAGVFPRCHS